MARAAPTVDDEEEADDFEQEDEGDFEEQHGRSNNTDEEQGNEDEDTALADENEVGRNNDEEMDEEGMIVVEGFQYLFLMAWSYLIFNCTDAFGCLAPLYRPADGTPFFTADTIVPLSFDLTSDDPAKVESALMNLWGMDIESVQAVKAIALHVNLVAAVINHSQHNDIVYMGLHILHYFIVIRWLAD